MDGQPAAADGYIESQSATSNRGSPAATVREGSSALQAYNMQQHGMQHERTNMHATQPGRRHRAPCSVQHTDVVDSVAEAAVSLVTSPSLMLRSRKLCAPMPITAHDQKSAEAVRDPSPLM